MKHSAGFLMLFVLLGVVGICVCPVGGFVPWFVVDHCEEVDGYMYFTHPLDVNTLLGYLEWNTEYMFDRQADVGCQRIIINLPWHGCFKRTEFQIAVVHDVSVEFAKGLSVVSIYEIRKDPLKYRGKSFVVATREDVNRHVVRVYEVDVGVIVNLLSEINDLDIEWIGVSHMPFLINYWDHVIWGMKYSPNYKPASASRIMVPNLAPVSNFFFKIKSVCFL